MIHLAHTDEFSGALHGSSPALKVDPVSSQTEVIQRVIRNYSDCLVNQENVFRDNFMTFWARKLCYPHVPELTMLGPSPTQRG